MICPLYMIIMHDYIILHTIIIHVIYYNRKVAVSSNNKVIRNFQHNLF